MAGIEKVCEFSGEYPGWLMYGYKRNHIQIIPKYRKLFRSTEAHIEITRVETILEYKGGGYSTWPTSFFDQEDKEWWEYRANIQGNKIKKDYWFCLVVKDAQLQGEVKGKYYNYTTDLKDTVKRLKRMLRCRNLKVIYKLKD